MPSNELFSLEILVEGQPLTEYTPEEDDFDYPSQRDLCDSDLDRVCYVEATPESTFTARVEYLGATKLSSELGYIAKLYVDGKYINGKMFSKPDQLTKTIESRHIAGGLEQSFVFFFISNSLTE
jgi:hypothetical protein